MKEVKRTNVGEVMTPSPRVIDGLATVREAVELMRNDGISSLVIDRRDERDEFGLVVVSDIAEKVIAQGRSLARTNVYEIMSKPVLTIDGAMDIKYALRLLGRFGLSRALVTDDGALVGIVTMRDMVLRYLADVGDDAV
jgi:signal-transduction protein with cAMP-binding, CBS, and nucleotidyltransferase domain